MIRIFSSINIYIYIYPIVRFRFVPYFSPKLWFATVPRVLCITRMESRGVTKAVHKYEIAAERCYATAVRYFYRPSFTPSAAKPRIVPRQEGQSKFSRGSIVPRMTTCSSAIFRKVFHEGIIGRHALRDTFRYFNESCNIVE